MMKISESANTPAMNDDELTRVFNEIDDDGNGYITPREAKKAFKKLAEKFNINRVSTNINRGPSINKRRLSFINSHCYFNRLNLKEMG
jgi:Ca2+-binding EF-hand superfamily protein